MAKTVIFAGGIEAFTSSTTARFTPFGNTRTGADYFSVASTDIEYPDAGTLSKFSVVVYANTRTGVASSTCGPYVNASSSALTVSIPIGTTGRFSDTTHTVSITANDDLSLGTHPQNGGGGNISLGNWLCIFDQTTGSSVHHVAFANGQSVGTGTSYVPIVCGLGANNFIGTEANIKIDTIAGTLSHMAARSASNARNGDTVFTLRKNGADATSTVTIPSSTTGSFVDTTHSDSVADGDDINYKSVRGGTTGTITLQSISIKHAGTGDAFMSYATGDAAFTPVASTDYYLHVGGLIETTYTDALTKQLWQIDSFEASRAEVVIPTNNITLDSALIFRKNGTDSTLNVAIPNETTGRFVDTTHTVSLASGDEINFKLFTDEAGSITVRQTGIKFSPVTESGNVAEIPLSAIKLTKFTPSAVTTENNTADVPLSAIKLTKFNPSAITTENNTADLPLGNIQLTPFEPTASSGDSNIAELPLSTILVASFAPTAETTEIDPNNVADLPLGSIQLSSFTPTVTVTGDQIIGNLDAAVVELDALDVVAIELDALDVVVTVIQ